MKFGMFSSLYCLKDSSFFRTTCRSPLSTTSLGIDCIISLLQAQNKHLTHLETELFDLAKDSKVTCAAAIHTLNDLLLFDKIENNMLQLDVQDVKSFPFFEDSIHPFIRQVSSGFVGYEYWIKLC